MLQTVCDQGGLNGYIPYGLHFPKQRKWVLKHAAHSLGLVFLGCMQH